MTLVLDLPPDVQQALDEAAATRQATVAEVVAAWLAEAAQRQRQANGDTNGAAARLGPLTLSPLGRALQAAAAAHDELHAATLSPLDAARDLEAVRQDL